MRRNCITSQQKIDCEMEPHQYHSKRWEKENTNMLMGTSSCHRLRHQRPSLDGLRRHIVVVLALLFLMKEHIVSAQEVIQNPAAAFCSCAPSTYEFTFDFSLTCPPVNVETGSGVEDTTCLISSFGVEFTNSSDSVPVYVSSVSIIETDINRRPIAQSQVTGNYLSGSTFTYTSVAALSGEGQPGGLIPTTLQLTITGHNAYGDTLLNVWAIRYSNGCSIYPLLEVGESAGWTIFSDLGTPRQDICPLAPIAPTETPSTFPTPSPTDSPTGTPSIVPTPPPTDSPTETPSIFPTPPPTDSPTDSPSIFPTPPPTDSPTDSPSIFPTPPPTDPPTDSPSIFPTPPPTDSPTDTPSTFPTPPTSTSPTGASPTTVSPTTASPTTTLPATLRPLTPRPTAPAVTASPTKAPETQSPTAPPATASPTTSPPTTAPPTTAPPTTFPSTKAPKTPAPKTSSPTIPQTLPTEAPTTAPLRTVAPTRMPTSPIIPTAGPTAMSFDMDIGIQAFGFEMNQEEDDLLEIEFGRYVERPRKRPYIVDTMYHNMEARARRLRKSMMYEGI